MMKFLLITLLLLFPGGLFATAYNAKVLKTKDYEKMRELLNKHITNSQNLLPDKGEEVEESVSELKKGLKTLLMRPDADAIKTSLILILQNEIIKYRSFMAVLQEVTEEAIDEFKSKKGSVAYQASLLYLIENSLSYLQSINNKESTAILKKIKKAQLKISKKIFNYLILEMGRGRTASPSYLAGQILKIREKELRKAALEKAKEEKRAKKAAEKKKRKPSSSESQNPEKTPKSNLQIDL